MSEKDSTSRARAVVELLRPPNVFTAVADSLASLVIVRGGEIAATDPGLVLLLASACLYLGGIALNDWADRDVDARERPERPIPSGRVPAGMALAIAVGLLVGGVALAFVAGMGTGALAVALAAAIALYDLVLKGGPAGFFVMGACRGLNFALPFGLAGATVGAATIVFPVLLTAWVAVFTFLAREEVGGNTPARARGAVGAIVVLAGCLLGVILERQPTLVAWALFAAVVARGVEIYRPLVRDPGPATTGRAIGGSILMIPLVDAVFVATAGHSAWALVVALLSVPALALRRLYSPT